jgi:hypothetical protein
MAKQFHERHFPVRPNLDQLKHQAKDLLRAVKQNEPAAVAELRKHHPQRGGKAIDPADAKLADVQAALARSYGLTSWPRLVTACRMTDAIWRGDADTVRSLILKDPRLLHEAARGVADSNWGPPMSYAANVGQDGIIAMLRKMGAEDLQHAFDRACLQGQIETARRLHAMGARVLPGMVMGPCETLNAEGLALLFELGAVPKASIVALSSWPSEASLYPTRPQWQCIAAASICSKRICAAIQVYSIEHFPTKKSICPRWDATPTIPSHCTARPWPEQRCCICVPISTRSRSHAGWLSVAPT